MKNIVIIGLCLMFHSLISFTQIIDEGTINGADYKIIIPENWNSGLVMYAHGYEEIGEEFDEEEEEKDEFPNIFTNRGFAYAASAYKKQGLVVKDGVEDTEALRSYFEMKYGKPELCIITGHSMGGMISIATIENYPAEYNGALPLCGWLAPVYSLYKRSLDMLVTYDYLFGENNGDIVTGEYIEPEEMQKSLDKYPKMKSLFAEHFRLREKDVAEVLGFGQFVLKESTDWLGGLPVGNEKTIYDGFGFADTCLNKNILRYSANPSAEEYAIEYYSPNGKIQDPVISLHTNYDEILPVSNYNYYEQATIINHTSHLYVQKYVIRDGHCLFEDEEVANAFDQLLTWIMEGKYPE